MVFRTGVRLPSPPLIPERISAFRACRVCAVCAILDEKPMPKTDWKIYEIQHRRGPDAPLRTRYQFTDGQGKRRHFATKAKARIESGKDKALYHQEGRLAAGLTDEERRDAASAVKLLPLGWTLTQAARFAAEHVSRIKITLTINEAVKRFLESRGSRSDMHYKDLNRRLNRWLTTINPTCDVATVEKAAIEAYLAQYTGRNQLNHLRALSNFFRFNAKIGAIGTVPTSGIDVSFRRSRVAYLESKVFSDLLVKAYEQNEMDILAWLVLGGFLGLRPFEAYHAHWSGVKWETSEFRVEADWSKTRRSRVLPIQPNAMEWLKIAFDLRKRDEQILPNHNTFTHRFVAWRELNHDMAFWRGKQDILRHSFGTHRMAMVRNAHQVAEEMGNSVAIVRRHYDAVLEPSKAAAWWQIIPKVPGNIVLIKAVA
jgi:site-specific recombinase XerC